MEYNYTDETLLHSVGFNLQRFESVLNHGIVSKHKAEELGLTFSKNYYIKGQDDDYISLVKVADIKPEEDISAYKLHTTFGMSFIIEGINYREDRDKIFIHRQDEVLVKDKIAVDNIVGVAIPEEFQQVYLYDICVLPPDITSYKNITDTVNNYKVFLKNYGYEIDNEQLVVYLQEIYYINKALSEIKDDDAYVLDKEELLNDYTDVLRDLNEFLAEESFRCFSQILGKNVTLSDVVNYLSKGKLNIYGIPYGNYYGDRGRG